MSVVFSWTVNDQDVDENLKSGDVLRHLSIRSLMSKHLPHPYVAFTIASWFGFTGGFHPQGAEDMITEASPDWIIVPHQTERTIMVFQKIPAGELPKA